ncbi:MAG TPA: dihydroneopterin aldolase [Candidatus Dormibacteraeota bacterium]|jgi:dihydroneopterin aldolase|nr:dihydroneopterin aldolase [Candidatus Dormibacteraeota bacterium]
MPRRLRSPASLDGRAKGAPAAHEILDWLRLPRIQGYGHLGVTQKERELGQRIEADVELAYAPTAKRRPDVIDDAIDYEEVHRMVRAQIGMSRCRLLETLAEELALALLQEFDSPRVRVHVRKLHVPVEEFTTTPEVVVERVRT